MRNVKPVVKANQLIITIDLSAEGILSKSGKSRVIATTSGNVSLATPDGRQFKLGLNVYTPEVS